jgi:diguanylate cyclase (GGDEF)-like protein
MSRSPRSRSVGARGWGNAAAEWLLVRAAGPAGVWVALVLALLALFAQSRYRDVSVASVLMLVVAIVLLPRVAVRRLRLSESAMDQLHEDQRRQSAAAQLERQELSQWVVDRVAHDRLTGLLSRAAFLERVAALPAEPRPGTARALVLLDLAEFAAFNQTQGAAAGDAMLVAVAARFAGALRPEDVLARVDGNVFGALLQTVPRDLIFELIGRLQRAVAATYSFGGLRHAIESRCGVVCLDTTEGVDAAEALRRAEVALQNAKATARPMVEFHPRLELQTRERLRFYADITHAIANSEFTLAYQPIVEIHTRRMSGVEALMRWHHPQRGQVSPVEFIPVAEASGQIVEMGLWALRTACRQQRRWAQLEVDLMVSVNLSARQLIEPDAVDRIADVITREATDPRRIKLEITESLVVEDTTSAVAVLHELRGLGVRLSIDDFGTGFASLTRLSELPIDELKIDRYFVGGIGFDGPRETILAAALGMAQGLGLSTVAEGVETVEQLDYLEAHGCQYVQGFIHAPALPPDEIIKLGRQASMTRIPQPREAPREPASTIPALLPSRERPRIRRLSR